MSAPAKNAAATPDLFAADFTPLLSGQLSWQELWPIATAWLVSSGLTVLLVAALTLIAARFYQSGVDRVFQVINGNLKPGAVLRVTQRTATLSSIVRSLGKAVIYFLGGMIILSKLGVNVAPILASAGIFGLAVGFGAQSLVKDVISGFFILIEDQYGVGDVIDVDGKSGLVEKMNLRITQLRNLDGNLITIPNGSIGTVMNMSKEWSRAALNIGVAYHEDPDRVIAVLQQLGDELLAEMPEKILEPIEIPGVDAFRDSEVVIKVLLKTQPLEQWAVARAFRRKVWYAFKEHGIEIPFPQRTLWLANEQQEKLADLVAHSRVPKEAPTSAEK